MIENESIRLMETKSKNLLEIIKIEKKYPQFIGQYNLDKHKAVLSNKNQKHLSIFNKADNSLIGYVILAGLLNSDHSIEFRRVALLKRGLGFGGLTIELIKEISFKIYKADKLWLDVFEDNHRAIKLYTKKGFVKEKKIMTTELKTNNVYRSAYIMSILKA